MQNAHILIFFFFFFCVLICKSSELYRVYARLENDFGLVLKMIGGFRLGEHRIRSNNEELCLDD